MLRLPLETYSYIILYSPLILKKKKFEEALVSLQKLVATQPNRPDLLGRRGMVLAQLGKWEEAIHDLKRAIEIEPQLSVARVNLGVSYLMRGMYTQALECFDYVVQTDHSMVEARNFLGMIVS